MKICHITCVHPRYDIRIFLKECTSLAEDGYETYLVVNDDLPDEIKNDVHIVSSGFASSNRKERFLNATKAVLKKALEIDAEVYHLHDPELLRIVDVLLKKGKKVIFDAHEDTEEQIKDKEWLPSFMRIPVAKVYHMFAWKKLKKVNGIITVTPKFVDKFKAANSNVVMVTNYPKIEIKDITRVESYGEKYIFFAGGISSQWCHEIVADAVNAMDGITYLFAGRGDSQYIQKIESLGKTKYLGMVSHDEVMLYYSKAIAGVAVLQCTQVGDEGTLGNTKLFEVMQAGIPVVCSDLVLWKAVVEENECGIAVKNDARSIASAVEFISSHPDEARKMGENGKKAIKEKYNWDTQAETLIAFYRSL